jgi:lipid II:glycine glycyltransferase (peptidoglycan interpeptide bridge formation enzyme)
MGWNLDDLHLEILRAPDDEFWNRVLSSIPNSHILQTSHWAKVKSRVGWKANYLIWKDAEGKERAAALVLSKKIPIYSRIFRTCIMYIPRGPIVDWTDHSIGKKVLNDLVVFARKNMAIFLKIDPDITTGFNLPESKDFKIVENGQYYLELLEKSGWQYSQDQVQFKNTVILDLLLSEDDLLSRMKQKTRYNIMLAKRKEVTIRKGNQVDFPGLYRMYAQTALRDGFIIRDEAYYLYVWNLLYDAGMAVPLIAEVDGKPISAIFLFMFAKKAYYFYGMSTGEHKDKMPNHLLQWEAILLAKSQGCIVYDFWGAPEKYNEEDSMWGVYRFKEGFNGEILSGIGAWDFILNRNLYLVYTQFIPAILKIMRQFGRKRLTKEVIE